MSIENKAKINQLLSTLPKGIVGLKASGIQCKRTLSRLQTGDTTMGI
jgi:hypothetical protein